MGVHFHLLGYINSFWRRREWGSRELARIKRYQSWAFLFGDKVTNSEKKKNGSTSSKASHLINVESKEIIGTKEKDAGNNNSKREVNKVTAL